MATLYKIVFGFFVFCLLYALWVRPFRNFFKLRLVIGAKGAGKSTYLVSVGEKYLKKGWDVYTNMKDCFLPGVKIIDAADFGFYMISKNSVCLFDEGMTIWDCRDFKSFAPEQRDAFVYQRHDKLIVYVAVQDYSVDKKIRSLCDEILLLQNVGVVWTLIRPIKKKLGLPKRGKDGEAGNSEDGFVDEMRFKSIFSWRFLFIPKFAQYFDSFVTEERPPIPFIQR